MRAAQSQASNLQATDASNAAQNNAQAQGINSTLNPFLQRELASPQGYSQQDQTAQLAAAMAGTGGATSGVTGLANLTAARTRNAAGFGSALDAAQRMRGQQNAQASENVAANNSNLKQQQMQEGAAGLQDLFGTDSSNALKALGLQDSAINTETTAAQSGWLQNAMNIAKTVGGVAGGAGSLGVGFGKNQIWGS
jgi:hypothetical protein